MLFLKGRQTPHCAVGDQCVLSDALLPRPPFHISPSTPPSRRPVQPPSPRLRQSRRVSGQPASRRAGWRLRGVAHPNPRSGCGCGRLRPIGISGRHPGPARAGIPARMPAASQPASRRAAQPPARGGRLPSLFLGPGHPCGPRRPASCGADSGVAPPR